MITPYQYLAMREPARVLEALIDEHIEALARGVGKKQYLYYFPVTREGDNFVETADHRFTEATWNKVFDRYRRMGWQVKTIVAPNGLNGGELMLVPDSEKLHQPIFRSYVDFTPGPYKIASAPPLKDPPDVMLLGQNKRTEKP